MTDRRFQLVALDVDGTLKPRNGPITPRVREAIGRCLARGVEVALATGRMFPSVLPFADELGLQAPIICLGGAMLRDPRTGATLLEQTIPLALAREIIALGREWGRAACAYVGDSLFVERVDPDSAFAGYVARSRAEVVADLLERLTKPPHHMALVSDEVRTRALVEELREHFGERLAVTSGHPLLAEIDHPGVSKGSALAHLAGRLGVEREGIIAIGDDWNDISMLEYAGLGVAMADATPEVLAAADAIAPSADEDGVAWALERYVV
jgi:Cof subfamily protein (haloacid dehalogenase superfamily)